jgi:hypothetical protein
MSRLGTTLGLCPLDILEQPITAIKLKKQHVVNMQHSLKDFD